MPAPSEDVPTLARMTNDERRTCELCDEPIEPDDLVTMARQVNTSSVGQLRWSDGMHVYFHAWHAPPSQPGVLRRID